MTAQKTPHKPVKKSELSLINRHQLSRVSTCLAKKPEPLNLTAVYKVVPQTLRSTPYS